jgi:hypothetical protein
MLTALFGNASIERILLFLFVNRECYGTQLQKAFQTALTPLQKALDRLEKEGVINGYRKGKVRLFQLNSSYPLSSELLLLLQRAYLLLSSEEKSRYYVPKSLPFQHTKATQVELLHRLWKRLQTVKKAAFQISCYLQENRDLNGKGASDVLVTQPKEKMLIFIEKGSWQAKRTGQINCSNRLSWTLDEESCKIRVEHLRHGLDAPVFLFDLLPYGRNTLLSIDAHFCRQDCYFGHLMQEGSALRLQWRVIGPKKNEEISYFYFF